MSLHKASDRTEDEMKLDRQFLRTSAVYRMLVRYGVTKDQALEMSQRPFKGKGKPQDISATIELWIKNPPKRFGFQLTH